MKTRNWLRKGFTLVEVIAVVAVVSVVASAGYYTASSVQETARTNKLEADVASLNSAVQIYEAVGGDLSSSAVGTSPGATNEEKVLSRLKVKGDAETASKFNGISGSMIDPRITSGEVVSDGKRAVWNSGKKRFEVTSSGGSGVKEFVLSDAAAVEARNLETDQFARSGRIVDAANAKQGDVWVWDYTMASPLADTAGSAPSPGTPGTPAVPGAEGVPPVPTATATPTPTPTPAVPPTDPTPNPSATVSPTATPTGGGGGGTIAGVIVSMIAKLNGEINGDTQLLESGGFQWNGATDINGDLYLPGTPTFTGNIFANNPGSITVVTGTGNENPRYNFDIGAGSISGIIYTRTNPSTNGLSQKDAHYVNYIMGNVNDVTTNAITLITTSNTAPNVNGSDVITMAGGNYGSMNIGGTIKLGSPNTTTYYNFQQLTVNGGGKIEILGPVVISLRNGGSLNNIIGTSVINQEWLTVYAQGPLTINGGGGIFGKKIVTSSTVEINGKISLTQGIIADSVGINGGGILSVSNFTN